MGFEADCKEFIKRQNGITLLEDNTSSYDKCDFILEYNKIKFALELKVKGSRYTKAWNDLLGTTGEDTFAFDETSIKNVFKHYPTGFMLVFDNFSKRYIVFNLLDLLCIPKKRINREIHKNVKGKKGKWVVDLKWGHVFENLDESFNYITSFLANDLKSKLEQIECYEIPKSGEILLFNGENTRTSNYWETDVSGK